MKRAGVIAKESENSGCRIKSDISGEFDVDFVVHSRRMTFHCAGQQQSIFISIPVSRSARVEKGILKIVWAGPIN